jgi:hypothetical protein
VPETGSLVSTAWWEDRRVKIPPRTVTDQYLARSGEHLDVVFDLDLGELVRGHHVVARGIMLGRPVRVPRYGTSRLPGLVRRGEDPSNGGGFIRRGEAREPAAVEERLTEPELHYEFVPGLAEERGFGWYWMLEVTDDVGTEYSDSNGGAFDGRSGGAASHGTRDLGGQIPPQARRLTIGFRPAEGWIPPGPWRRTINIDLRECRLLD